MKRRHFLQLAAGVAAGAMAEHSLGLPSCPTPYWLRIDPGFVVHGRAGEPMRVRVGERVLFHICNAGVKEDVLLHLPGHRFTVVALDGNPVPTPAAVDVLALAAGERIEAMVEMNTPGTWLLGSVDDSLRASGLCFAVEYVNRNGAPQWHAPIAVDWSYARFSAAGRSTQQPDELIEMLFEAPNGNHHWVVHGRSCKDVESLVLQSGPRYRLRMMNATSTTHSLQLRRHRLALTRVNQIPVSGIIKDTVRLERYNVIEADVV